VLCGRAPCVPPSLAARDLLIPTPALRGSGTLLVLLAGCPADQIVPKSLTTLRPQTCGSRKRTKIRATSRQRSDRASRLLRSGCQFTVRLAKPDGFGSLPISAICIGVRSPAAAGSLTRSFVYRSPSHELNQSFSTTSACRPRFSPDVTRSPSAEDPRIHARQLRSLCHPSRTWERLLPGGQPLRQDRTAALGGQSGAAFSSTQAPGSGPLHRGVRYPQIVRIAAPPSRGDQFSDYHATATVPRPLWLDRRRKQLRLLLSDLTGRSLTVRPRSPTCI